MRTKVSIMILAALAAALIVPVQALASGDGDACAGEIGGGDIAGVTSAPVVGDGVMVPITDANKGPLYLDVRDVLSSGETSSPEDDWLWSIWIYQETNGVNKLQRGGKGAIPDVGPLSSQDPCKKFSNHDQDIF